MSDRRTVGKSARVGMAVFSHYPDDPRVRREADALVGAGMDVSVCCLRAVGQPTAEVVRGVRVRRLPVMRKRGSPLRYLWEYATFLMLASGWLTVSHLRKRLDLVHVHNMPDVLAFAGVVPRLFGARVILDLHDPMPEVFMAKYGLESGHPVIRMLRFLERWSIRFAHRVLTPNGAFRNLFILRGCPSEKIAVVMNTPDPAVFTNRTECAVHLEPRRSGEYRLMYHGTIVERHGLDIALDAVSLLRHGMPGVSLHVFGEGDFVEPFLAYVRKQALEDRVRYHGQVSQETIAAVIPLMDVGVIPNRRTVFTEINLPTRIFEYLSHGKPVVAPRTKGIGEYFGEDALHFFEPGSARSLADSILSIIEDPSRAARVLEKGMHVLDAHRWEVEKQAFVALVTDLVGSGPVAPVVPESRTTM